jgi:uncharacterized membrane protein
MVYGAIGWAAEVALLMARDALAGRAPKPRVVDRVVMIPVYGLGVPLFEPLHDAMRHRLSAPARALAYAAGFFAVEYSVGFAWRRVAGAAPWDYSDARLNVSGLIRLDYLPLWAAVGLFGERLHDALTPPQEAVGRVHTLLGSHRQAP